MIRVDSGFRAVGVGAVVLMLTACGGSASPMSGVVPTSAKFARAMTAPPTCKGQRTTKKYGNVSVKLKPKGGSFCIPAFGGFGGSIEYPGAKPAAKLTIRTSTQNIYNEPQLGNGTSIVYLNLHFHKGTHFGSYVNSGAGGLTSEAIASGDTYTAYGIVAVGFLELRFPPCYAVATQGPYGGVLPNIGNLFANTTITGAGYGVIEIYSGEQVSQEC